MKDETFGESCIESMREFLGAEDEARSLESAEHFSACLLAYLWCGSERAAHIRSMAKILDGDADQETKRAAARNMYEALFPPETSAKATGATETR